MKLKPSIEQHELADFLLSLAPSSGFLVKNPREFSDQETKAYITLDEGTWNNKNAVSILHRRRITSFMVPDWTFEAQAQALKLTTEKVENDKVGKRLAFPKLSKALIQERQAEAFFAQLLATAKDEARNRQNKTK